MNEAKTPREKERDKLRFVDRRVGKGLLTNKVELWPKRARIRVTLNAKFFISVALFRDKKSLLKAESLFEFMFIKFN